MDNQITAYEMTVAELDGVGCIERCYGKEIHVRGLEKLAQAANRVIVTLPYSGYMNEGEPDAIQKMQYRGYTFFQLKRGVYHR